MKIKEQTLKIIRFEEKGFNLCEFNEIMILKEYVKSKIHVTGKTIIRLFGEHGSGKDVWADILCFVLWGKKFSFADYLRQQFVEDAGISLSQIDSYKRLDVSIGEILGSTKVRVGGYDVTKLSTRDAMITVAENTKLEQGQGFYSSKVLERLENSKNLDAIIITDTRFEIERLEIEEFAERNGYKILDLVIGKDLAKVEII